MELPLLEVIKITVDIFWANSWPKYEVTYLCNSTIAPALSTAAVCPVLSCFSGVRLFATLWTVAHQAPLSMGFFRQEYWSGLPFPPPGIFLTQRLNQSLPQLLHCRQTLSWLSHLSTTVSSHITEKDNGPREVRLFFRWGDSSERVQSPSFEPKISDPGPLPLLHSCRRDTNLISSYWFWEHSPKKSNSQRLNLALLFHVVIICNDYQLVLGCIIWTRESCATLTSEIFAMASVRNHWSLNKVR